MKIESKLYLQQDEIKRAICDYVNKQGYRVSYKDNEPMIFIATDITVRATVDINNEIVTGVKRG